MNSVSKFGLSSLFKGGIEPKLHVAVPNRIIGQSVIRKVIKRADGVSSSYNHLKFNFIFLLKI